jgi:hypothetical protein
LPIQFLFVCIRAIRSHQIGGGSTDSYTEVVMSGVRTSPVLRGRSGGCNDCTEH